MALLVWLAMFPYSTAIHYGLAQLPFIADWPLIARAFCLTCMLVPYMVFIALPFLNRRFQYWIQARAGQEPEQTPGPQPNANPKIMHEQYPHLVANGASI